MTADQQPPSAAGGADLAQTVRSQHWRHYDFPKICFVCRMDMPCSALRLADAYVALRAERDAIKAELSAFHAVAEREVRAWIARSDEHRARAERAEAALRDYATEANWDIGTDSDFRDSWMGAGNGWEVAQDALAAPCEEMPADVDWKGRAERAEAALREIGSLSSGGITAVGQAGKDRFIRLIATIVDTALAAPPEAGA